MTRRRARRIRGMAALALGLVAASLLAAEPSTAQAGAPPAAGSEAGTELSRRAGERWREASPRVRRARREAMQGLIRALPDARPIERLAILREAARLPRPERRALGERLRRVDALGAEERRALVAELEALLARANADIERFERNLERWEQLPEAERERYRAQLRRLREMPFEERRRLLEEWERSRGQGSSAQAPGMAPSAEPRPDAAGAAPRESGAD